MGEVVNWNYFRYAADYLHFGGMTLGLGAIVKTRSVEGFSRKTQVLYQMVYVARYLDIFVDTQATYLLFFKVTFNLITLAMITSFSWLHESYDTAADSCNVVAILVPVAIAAFFASGGSPLTEELWTFSEFLEPFALLPQYIMCYRGRMRSISIIYILCVGGYRVLYVFNWIYKRWMWASAYHDYTSWLGGTVECLLFFDFVLRIAKKPEMGSTLSMVGRLVLQVDEGASKLSETLEMRTIGRRLPYGLSGPTPKDDGEKWDVTDRLADEESCKLLTLSGDDGCSY